MIDGIATDETDLVIQASTSSGLAPARPLAPADTVVELVIARTGSIGGTVSNPQRVSRVWARSVADREIYSTDLDLAGDFQFEQLPPGDYDVSVSGHNTLEPKRVTVVADASVSVVFAVPLESITLALHVTGEGRVWLTTLPTADGSTDWLTSAEPKGGVAELVDVSPGHYQVCVLFADCTPIDVPPSPLRQDVTLSAPASPAE